MNGGFARKHRTARVCLPLFSILLVLLLFFPATSMVIADGETESGAPELTADPPGRLPSTPQEAHQRLDESGIDWPSGEEGADFSGASVQAGVRVALPYDTVQGFTTNANAGVKVDLWHGGSIIHTINTTTNNNRWFYADFAAASQDIQSGDRIDVTDLAGGATVSIVCTLTGAVNVSNDRVTGNALSGNTVDVYIKIPSTYYGDIPPGVAHRQVTAAGGAYTANFAGTNIRNGDEAYIFSTNTAGHVVMDAGAGGVPTIR
jgi:hypothetical protein